MEYDKRIDSNFKVFSKRNILVYGSVAVSFFINVYIILFRVGTDKLGYAGFDENLSLEEYFRGIVYSYQHYTRWYVNIGVILIALLLVKAGIQNWKKYGGFILICSYVLLVQVIVHAKSGMWERYLIPWIFGYAVLFVIVGYKMMKQAKIIRVVYLTFIGVLVFLEAPLALAKARDYAYDGRMTAVYFQTIMDNTDRSSCIVSAFYDGELNLSTECWLQDRDRMYVYSVNPETGKMTDEIPFSSQNSYVPKIKDVKVITCYSSQVDKIWDMLGLREPEKYGVSVNGRYAVICVELSQNNNLYMDEKNQ